MLHRHPRIAIVFAFVLGAVVSQSMTGHTHERPQVPNNTSERVVKALREKLQDTTWRTGPDSWIRFLSDMKTTNMLDRTGNWVVTDEKTVITGGRGPVGALYVWKLDKSRRKAELTKFVRDKTYQKSATMIDC